MQITIYGSHLCQDTLFGLLKVKDLVHGKDVQVTFKNISTNFAFLKEFMKNRENNPLYDIVKENDGVGMPYFVFEDGSETLDLDEALNKIKNHIA